MKRFGILAVTAAFVLFACGPDVKKYEVLKDPKISVKPDQKMLVLEVSGDPNLQTKEVGKLFQVYFKLKFEGKKMVAPRARWPKPFDTPRNEWVGLWAMPIGEEVKELPAGSPANMRIETWTYGETAEILHIGPYSTELPTVERLHQFIKDSGYVMDQPHEEEYIIGPGMFGAGNSKKYYTIIRYAVKPVSK